MGDEPIRCWPATDPLDIAYHDDEWGRPVLDERRLLEKLCLEGFQSGLSWRTILHKRIAFRKAFANFEPSRLAEYDSRDVERLLENAAIVRHRGKIEATIANGRAALNLRQAATDLAELIWSYRVADRPPPRRLRDMPATTPESHALSKELKRRGFRFVGPTTVYSLMQACGIVNDHLATCHVREAVERERAGAIQALR